MLTAKADREAVYAAHKAAGAAALWFCTFIHYQEDGVAYPDGIAGWNDFTGNFSQAAELACEILEAGLYPCIELGGDELGSQTVIDQFPAFMAAMKSSRLGDLTQGGLMVTPTFDSDADGDWSDPGDNWARVFVALRRRRCPMRWCSVPLAASRLGKILGAEEPERIWMSITRKPAWTASAKRDQRRPTSASSWPRGPRFCRSSQSGTANTASISHTGRLTRPAGSSSSK